MFHYIYGTRHSRRSSFLILSLRDTSTVNFTHTSLHHFNLDAFVSVQVNVNDPSVITESTRWPNPVPLKLLDFALAFVENKAIHLNQHTWRSCYSIQNDYERMSFCAYFVSYRVAAHVGQSVNPSIQSQVIKVIGVAKLMYVYIRVTPHQTEFIVKLRFLPWHRIL